MEEWAPAADRHGIAATADLRRAGLSAGQIESLVASDELTPLARGWYAVGVPQGPEARHVLVARALVRARHGQVVASHHSALLIIGLPTYRADLSRVRLPRRAPGPTRTRAGYSVGRAVPASAQLAETVAPALAVVQHGLSSGPLSALVAADAVLHRRLATPEDLSSPWTGSGSIRDRRR